MCRSGVTYSMVLPIGKGESLDYSISKVRLRDASTLWSGKIVGDGRNHTLTYVYLFNLPATDALPTRPGPVARWAQPL